MENKIDALFNIILELDARETTNNCIRSDLFGYSWEQLCNKGIRLFEELKNE